MDYKKMLIEEISKIDDEKLLRFLYVFVMDLAKEE